MEEFRINRQIRVLDFEMPSSHCHESCELYYLVSGKCRMFVGHQLYYLEPGNVLLLAPGTLHRASYPDRERTERITINFPMKLLAPLNQICGPGEIEKLFHEVWISLPLTIGSTLDGIMYQMEEEVSEGDNLSLFLAKNRLYELVSLMLRYRIEANKGLVLETEELIQQAARHIYENYEEPLTLVMMAGQVHMTPSYFSRKFKQVTGFGFKEYLTFVRISHAEKLLADTMMPVTEIATVCGFGDGNYFGDSFRKVKGVSPRAYRKQKERVK